MQTPVRLVERATGTDTAPPSVGMPTVLRTLCIACYAALRAAAHGFSPSAIDLCRQAPTFVAHVGRGMGATNAHWATTTEVYPDSPRASDQQCNDAQVASVRGALTHVMRELSLKAEL